jgi:deazaflavin-dependent oxidoreductase (nitroreductase family)
MALQRMTNVVMRGLLSTPVISSGIGKRLITLHVVGRKSGKHYDVPVAYLDHEGAILIGTPFAWGKNLRTGEPLEVQYKGKRRTADVEVVKDETGVVALYDVICRGNHAFARFNKVKLDAAGNPDPGDLRAAWENGGRVFKLTLR